MKALVWKEVRELAPGFALFVGSALALGVVDVAYNWHHKRFVGISLIFCWLISLVAALLGGANSFAREQRQQLSFLGTWPVSRRQMWAAKVLVPITTWLVLVVASFGICGGLLAMRGYDPMEVFIRDLIEMDAWVHVALWAGLFALGLVASTAIPSPIGAVIAAVPLGGLLIGLYAYLYGDFIPGQLGPKLGLALPDLAQTSHLLPALVMVAVCVISSAVGFLGARMLERLRRGVMVGASFVGLMGVAVGLSLGVAWFALRPEPPAEYGAEVDGSGEWVVLHAYLSAGMAPPGRGRGPLWAVRVSGGPLRLIARGPTVGVIPSPGRPRIMLSWGSQEEFFWFADLPTGRLRRLPDMRPESGGDWGWPSPRGTYLARDERTVLRISEGRIELVDMREQEEGEERRARSRHIVGWAPDESAMYVQESAAIVPVDEEEACRRRLFAVSVPGGQRRLVVEIEGRWEVTDISPDGRWMVAYRSVPQPEDRPPAPETALIDVRSGELRELGGLWPTYRGWSPDGKYLWCRAWENRRDLKTYWVVVLEVPTLRVLTEVHPADIGGWIALAPWVSRSGEKVLITARDLERLWQKRTWWVADVDGGNLRELKITARDVVGWTHDDELIVKTEDNRLVRMNVETRSQEVVYTPPRQ